MANPHRGEVTLEAGGTTYTLRFSLNSFCEVEDLLGMKIDQILAAVQANDFKATRGLLWAALIDSHEIDLKAAGRLIPEDGVTALIDKLSEAIRRSFPNADQANPPQKAKPEQAGASS